MKVEIKEELKQEELKYPCIKECKDSEGYTIVLFYKENEGTCLYSTDEGNDLGHYSINWTEEIFTIFNGEITLKN